MASLNDIIGSMTLALNIVEGTQAYVTEAGEKLQSARGVALGVAEDQPSQSINEIAGLMNNTQADLESVHQQLAGIHDRINAYIAAISTL